MRIYSELPRKPNHRKNADDNKEQYERRLPDKALCRTHWRVTSDTQIENPSQPLSAVVLAEHLDVT